MKYNFYILTTTGMKNGFVNSNYDFSNAPFGFVPYRKLSSSTAELAVLEDFWKCVDIVLKENNCNHTHFIRAVRAYCDDVLYGEMT